ncbi:MAG: hypothetical protein WBB31_19275, partial [Saprospiraceae bacterium]
TFSDPFMLRFGACTDGTNSSWGNPSSWQCNVVPDANTDVFITDFNSMLWIFSNAFCRSLTLLPGSRLFIKYPNTVSIGGP